MVPLIASQEYAFLIPWLLRRYRTDGLISNGAMAPIPSMPTSVLIAFNLCAYLGGRDHYGKLSWKAGLIAITIEQDRFRLEVLCGRTYYTIHERTQRQDRSGNSGLARTSRIPDTSSASRTRFDVKLATWASTWSDRQRDGVLGEAPYAIYQNWNRDFHPPIDGETLHLSMERYCLSHAHSS